MTNSVYTLDKKRTALIRRKFGVGKVKLQVEQAREGRANEDHLQIDQKCGRDMKRTIKTSDMALRLVEFIRHRVHRLQVLLTHELRFL